MSFTVGTQGFSTYEQAAEFARKQGYGTDSIQGAEARVDVIDRKIFKSGLLENLNSARIYLQEHLNVRYKYRKDWKRENVYELPMDALREAVANALMHRDYFISGTNITVAIFDDRVEISSPGGLPRPLTIKDLGKMSKRRNETISDLFSRLDFVEKFISQKDLLLFFKGI